MLRNSSNAAMATQDPEIAHIRLFRQTSLLDHLGEAAAKVFMLMERRRQRLALLELDSRLIQDVGLSRAEILQECSKPVWRR
jgi:uncharacterized protein YjiS (DUF1127 family)